MELRHCYANYVKIVQENKLFQSTLTYRIFELSIFYSYFCLQFIYVHIMQFG